MKPISPPAAGAASPARLRNRFAFGLALIAALLLPAPAAQAQCDARLQCCATPRPGGDPSCGGESPTELPPSGPRVGAGNPLDIVTGNKHQRETDFPAMPGVLGLELVRHYNSALSHRNDGRLGRGWRLSYQAELVAGSESLSIVQADGTTVRFTRGIVEPDAYLSPDPAHGRVQRIRSSIGEHFMWTWPNGRTLRFDHGKLLTIMEASGEFVSLTYAPNGLLMQVRDPQNRAMYLIYDRQWRLVGVDTPVGRFSYAYDGRPGNLATATQPGDGSLTRTYHYEDPRHPHALTGITAAGVGSDGRALAQRLTTWAYDDKAHAVSSVQGDGTGHVDRVSVQRRYTDQGGEAKLINSLGNTTLYRWRTIGGHSRLLDAMGPGCSTCGPTNMRYGYDKQGRLTVSTRLDDKGKPAETIRHALDPRGRVVETSRTVHNSRSEVTHWLVRYRYAKPQDHAPAVIVRPSIVPGKEHTLRIVRNDAGQPITVTEEGLSPLDDNGTPVEGGTALRRTTTYAYTVINRRSLLAQVDGPLPNGPAGTPQDSDITRFQHDGDGNRVVGITHPMALKAQFQYDAEGRLVTHTPADGVPLQHVMDKQGRTTGWTRGSLGVSVQRDALGRVTRVERNDGSRFEVHHDAAGRAVAASDAQGNRREMKFDSEGRMLEAVWRDAAGYAPFDAQRVEYDAAGRPVAGTGGWRASYDDQGRLQTVEDVLRRQSRYHYDDFGRLAARELRLPADASPPLLKTAQGNDAGSIVRTQVLFPDHAGEAGGVVAANGARTTSDIDDFGRTVRLSSPDTGVETARYDEANRLLERIDGAGNRTTFQYDLLGRLIGRRTVNPARPDDVEDARWTYHGTLLVQSANRHQSDTYRWDAEHRLSEQTTRLARLDGGSSSHEFVTRYSYDNVGRLAEKRLPDGLVVVHQYDVHGAPARLTLRYPNGKEQPIIDSLKADPVHGLREVTFGNGVVTAYAKDRHGRIAGIVTASQANGESKPLYAQRITYDAGGRITAIDRNGIDEHYGYDGQDRLIEVRTPHEHRGFAYDEVGNRTAVWQPTTEPAGRPATGAGIPQQSLTYTPRSNRLLAILGEQPSNTSYRPAVREYDATGNPTSIGQRQYVYGVNGRLREVTESDNVLGRYVYNVAGQRVGKQAGKATTHYLYVNNRIVAEADAGGRITAHYFYWGDAAVAKVETEAVPRAEPGWADTRLSLFQQLALRLRAAVADTDSPIGEVAAVRVLYLHTDHIATPRLATDTHRRVVWAASYDAFGFATEQTDVDRDGLVIRLALRFQGQHFDEETQYHYNYFRNYDPRLGRFLEPDLIGISGGINLYAYAELDPLRRTDPLGLYTEIIRWARAPGLNGAWGHISGNVNGKNYSFGPNGWDTRYPLAKDYAERQRAPGIDREGAGIILNLTRDEEDTLGRCLIGYSDYHPLNNNCGNPFLRCLDELDVTYSGNRPQVLPEDVMKVIGTSKRAMGVTHYPGSVKLHGYPQSAHRLLGGDHLPAGCDAGDRCLR